MAQNEEDHPAPIRDVAVAGGDNHSPVNWLPGQDSSLFYPSHSSNVMKGLSAEFMEGRKGRLSLPQVDAEKFVKGGIYEIFDCLLPPKPEQKFCPPVCPSLNPALKGLQNLQLTDSTCDVILHKEEYDVILNREECDVILHREECDVILHKEECDVILHKEECDVILHKEECDAILYKEECDVILHKEECDVILNREPYDVILHGEDPLEDFPCHRALLCACSSYFSAMFANSNFKESGAEIIQLKNIANNVLKNLINFAYTSKVKVEEETVEDLLVAADFLDMQPVRDKCRSFMVENMNAENCLRFHFLAEHFNCTNIAEKYQIVALANFTQVCASEEFLELTSKEVIRLIRSDACTVKEEKIVFMAVVRWLEHAPADRVPDFLEMLKDVRLSLLSLDFLKSVVAPLPTISANEDAMKLVKEALYYHGIPNDRHKWKSPRCRLRDSFEFEDCIVCGTNGNTLFAFNPRKITWSTLEDSPKSCTSGELVQMGGKLYLCGGSIHQPNSDVFQYDLATRRWTTLASMLVKRGGHDLVVVDGCIYAVGGSSSSIERLNHERGPWTRLDAIAQINKYTGAVSHEGYLYVFGGYALGNRYDEHPSRVLRYDPRTAIWTELAGMPVTRVATACVMASGRIMTIGGRYDSEEKVNAYDTKLNTWTRLAYRSIDRLSMCDPPWTSGCKAVLFEDKIMVLRDYLKKQPGGTMEVYDEEQDQWTLEKTRLLPGVILSSGVLL